MAITLTEPHVAEMAPDANVLQDGRKLVKSGHYLNLGKSADGTLFFGQCKGSGKNPYEVSCDLATGVDERPTTRCSCPSQKRPCKHAVGLMLAMVGNANAFAVKEPPADLVEKRGKLMEKREKDAHAPTAPTEETAKKKKVNQAAANKKAQEQADALDTLETFLVDLVTLGLGGLNKKSVTTIETQAKRMMDNDLRGADAMLRHLASLVESAPAKGKEKEEGGTATFSPETQAQIAFLLTQLWVTVRKGRKALEGKLEEGTTQSESDAQVESILGRAWKLDELRERGYWGQNKTLMELSHEHRSDSVTEMESAFGFMLDLDDGSIWREWTALPTKAMKMSSLRPSRLNVLTLKDVALYPGDVVNRRIRWDERWEGNVKERERTSQDYVRLHGHAKPFEVAIKALQAQLKNPLDPLDAVALLKVKRFGMLGEKLVMEDDSGARLVVADPPDAQYETSANLSYAAGGWGPGTVAARLWFDLVSRSIYAQGLALFVGDNHLRLGM